MRISNSNPHHLCATAECSKRRLLRELLAALDGDVFLLVLPSHVPGGCTPGGNTRLHGALARRASAYSVPAQHTSNLLRLGWAKRSIRQLRTAPLAAPDGNAFS